MYYQRTQKRETEVKGCMEIELAKLKRALSTMQCSDSSERHRRMERSLNESPTKDKRKNNQLDTTPSPTKASEEIQITKVIRPQEAKNESCAKFPSKHTNSTTDSNAETKMSEANQLLTNEV